MISAFLFGRARRLIFIEVLTADPRSQLDGVLTTLVGSLYGPRDAPLIWQDRLRCQMKLLGFKESLRVRCKFYHETKDVEMVAHVDDIFVVGCLKDVQDVHRGFASAVERKCKYAGPKTGNSEVEYIGAGELCSRKTGEKFMEIPSMQSFYSKRLEWKCASL